MIFNFNIDKDPHFCVGRVFPRLIFSFLLGLGVMWLIKTVVPFPIPDDDPKVKKEIIFPIVFILLSEGIIFIDYLLDKYIPYQPKKSRSLFQLLSGVAWMMLVIGLTTKYFVPDYSSLKAEEADLVSRAVLIGLFFGASLVFVLTLALLNHKTLAKFRDSIKEIEQLKQEKLMLDYQALQDQLNPHFLFNSLSVLISEIQYDQDNAVKMTQQLSNVYRYVINSREKMVIELKNELEFAMSFFFLQKTRIGDGVELNLQVPEHVKSMKLPPLSLQTLIENAIKHNIADLKRPLVIEVFMENTWLVIKNNLQPKSTTYSTKTGLDNLKKRFELLGEEEIQVEKNETDFIVKIPLMN